MGQDRPSKMSAGSRGSKGGGRLTRTNDFPLVGLVSSELRRGCNSVGEGIERTNRVSSSERTQRQKKI